MTPEEAALRDSIESLYEVFSSYPLAASVEACPCCTTAGDHQRINSKPLRDLSGEDLDHFAAKALTTWGGEADLKHFLPRLFEILAFQPLSFTLPEALIGKLTYEGTRLGPYDTWHRWPEPERLALTQYFETLWLYRLTQPGYPHAHDWLEMLVHAHSDLTPFLQAWSAQLQTEAAVAHLAVFLYRHDKELQRGQLKGADWDVNPGAMKQFIAWARDARTEELLKQGLPRIRHLPWLSDAGVIEDWIEWVLL